MERGMNGMKHKSILTRKSRLGILLSVFILGCVFFSQFLPDSQKEGSFKRTDYSLPFSPKTSDPNAFISRWDTTLGDGADQIELPIYLSGNYNCLVKWGDGEQTAITSGSSSAATHYYTSAGIYTINITGTIEGWRFNDAGDKEKLIEIQQWGCLRLGNLGGYFYGCGNLELTAIDSLDLTGTTTLNQAFRGCTNLGSKGDMNGWNVSGVTSTSYMFYGATSFNQPIGNWNMSNVGDISMMFYEAAAFNQPIGSWKLKNLVSLTGVFRAAAAFNQPLNDWDVSRVSNFAYVFAWAINFNQPLENWNVSSATTLYYMFWNASSFNHPLNGWDVSKVVNLHNTFCFAENFNQPLNDWDVSSVTDMYGTFSFATNFNQTLMDWDTSAVSDMRYLFNKARSFNHPLNAWDVSSVTQIYGMLSDADVFNQPLDTWDITGITDLHGMFWGANAFNQDLSSWDVSSVTNFYQTFYYCESFNQSLESWEMSNATDISYMFYYNLDFNQPLNNWNVSSVTDMSYLFYWATSFNQPLDTWNVSRVTDMSYMFNGASSFNHSLSNWDVSCVTDMNRMFLHAENFNQPLNSWDVSNVHDMTNMFALARVFNQPLFNWDVSNVEKMNYMFASAEKFNQEIGNWEVCNVTEMTAMFCGAISFNQPLNNWNVSKVTRMNAMFTDAASFNQPLNNWEVSNVIWMTYMFEGAISFDQSIGDWNVSSVSTMYDMFESVKLSTQNYDALLIGWSQLQLQNGVQFSGGNSRYSSNSADARQYILDTYGWTIIDGGSLTDSFILTSDAGAPDEDGSFLLSWSECYEASNYSVYQHTGYITEFNTTLLSIASQIIDLSLPIIEYSPGTYFFIVVANTPYGPELSNCLQVVVDYSNTLNITYPDSSAKLLQGKAIFIQWNSTGNIEYIKLELYDGNRFIMEIVANTSNSGMYGWLVPTELGESTEYRIKISDAADPDTFAFSEYFEIYSDAILGFNVSLIIGLIALSGVFMVLRKKDIMKKSY
ncbi:MAG: BspA family leucine-rich repeat surface protein [Promethearchaeota archaeon]|nr:MAG: BspA family leucine-rich repeat surface protein [Candidatus Lokiarchaeota archaeon]